ENDDTINGFWDLNNVLRGNGGNDTLNGAGYNDALYGGKGNDKLNGSDGNDILDGGEDSDSLNGGYGADTYIFKKGYGVDTINNYTYYDYSGDIDILKMDDINDNEVVARRTGNDLELRVKNVDGSLTGDKAVVTGYFNYGTYAVDKIQFANGAVWDTNSVNKAIALNNQTITLTTNTAASVNYSAIAELAVHEMNTFTADSSMYNCNQYSLSTKQNVGNDSLIIKTS
ncbi:hypothetical protein JHL18_16110, partial [Clostridium sp. YIM B02505]